MHKNQCDIITLKVIQSILHFCSPCHLIWRPSLKKKRSFSDSKNKNKEVKQMLTFEDVLEIFRDYLLLDPFMEVLKSRTGYVRIGLEEDSRYCMGVVCRTAEELFDLLLSDYRSHMEICITGGCRELEQQESEEIDLLCQKYMEEKAKKISEKSV